MPAMILCAGLGRRLLPLSSWTAKPLVPVGDRPALARILEQVRIFDGPTVLNAHHHADQVRAFLEREDPNVRVSYEKDLLDTAGGVHQGLALLGDAPDALLVWNGDALVDLDVQALRVAHAMS